MAGQFEGWARQLSEAQKLRACSSDRRRTRRRLPAPCTGPYWERQVRGRMVDPAPEPAAAAPFGTGPNDERRNWRFAGRETEAKADAEGSTRPLLIGLPHGPVGRLRAGGLDGRAGTGSEGGGGRRVVVVVGGGGAGGRGGGGAARGG
ncbi:hypothetical protein MARPO_0061s0141 [Marchantia polymorpha]|uniref:Uncharacterized protein n=1 Tax=Marchantia polymorpha TaxID=3197 RepID=A0A2R6WSR5_MARPO|nr:hypothetical protein MARPO_0061s0141 [Marchantia polymorpha]|eukprot:PTQ36901.1 hypothetical protein MARPO_0061s0141 [Marchantia polymorpha]